MQSSQTDVGKGKRIGSPTPGNLPDNGMWTVNNIHKYSDEARWGRRSLWRNSCQRHVQWEHCCVGGILSCHVAHSRMPWFLFVLCWADLLLLTGWEQTSYWFQEVMYPGRPRFTSTISILGSFPSNYVLRPQSTWQWLATDWLSNAIPVGHRQIMSWTILCTLSAAGKQLVEAVILSTWAS